VRLPRPGCNLQTGRLRWVGGRQQRLKGEANADGRKDDVDGPRRQARAIKLASGCGARLVVRHLMVLSPSMMQELRLTYKQSVGPGHENEAAGDEHPREPHHHAPTKGKRGATDGSDRIAARGNQSGTEQSQLDEPRPALACLVPMTPSPVAQSRLWLRGRGGCLGRSANKLCLKTALWRRGRQRTC